MFILKNNVIITAIGPATSGKSTALAYLTELFWENGVEADNIKCFSGFSDAVLDYISSVNFNVTSIKSSAIIHPSEPKLIVVDGVNDEESAKKIQDLAGFLFKISRKGIQPLPWVAQMSYDAFITTDADGLRMFNFLVRQSLEELKGTKKFKAQITDTQEPITRKRLTQP